MKHKSSRIMLFVLLSVLFLGMTFVYADTAEEYFNRGLANDKRVIGLKLYLIIQMLLK